MQSTIVPFLIILEKWLYYGILEDLHKEFFVEETAPANFNENAKVKYEENYWNDKYTLILTKVPCFFEGVANKIFLTGKYVNVIKVYDPKREFANTMSLSKDYIFTLHNDEIKACVDRTFESANKQLIEVILIKEQFVNVLKSIKKYFFMENGDYFIHFMDLSENELTKNSKLISVDKLSNFLEIAIKTSSVSNDPYNENITCELTSYSTFEILQAFDSYSNVKNKKNEFELQGSIANVYGSKKGFETLTLNYKIKWPLNLILTEKALFKYQMLFRYLFQLKYSERQLSSTWQLFMEQSDLGSNLFFKRAMSTVQKMIHFNRTLTYHFLIDVVNRKWEDFIQNLQNNVQTFENIIGFHESFLQSIFTESMLLDAKFKVGFYTINNFILFFCDNMKNLIGSCVNYDYKNILVYLLA